MACSETRNWLCLSPSSVTSSLRPARPLIDPPPNHGDLVARQRRALGGHAGVGVLAFAGDHRHDQTVGAAAGDDRGLAGVAGGEGVGLVVDAVAALLLLGVVALGTGRLEDRAHVTTEVDGG